MNVTTVAYVGDPNHGKGRNEPRLYGAPPPFEHRVAANARGLGGLAIMLAGCWDMLPAVNGGLTADNQGATSRCFGHSSAKRFGLFQYGQSGIAVRYSADWAYKCDLSEIRRVELGGAPSYEELLANPLADQGSEPSAGYAAFRRLGLAPEVSWPTPQGLFTPKELDLGGVIAGQLYRSLAADFSSLVAPAGTALTQAALVALSKTPSGKRGTSIGLSIGSATALFDNADGSTVMTSSCFAAAYDHAPCVIGAAHVSLLQGLYTVSADESPGGYLFLLDNSWGTNWATRTMVPILDSTGAPTGGLMPFAGAVWISEKSFWQAADQSTTQEAA